MRGQEGTVIGLSSPNLFITWDSGEEETVRGQDVINQKKGFGR